MSALPEQIDIILRFCVSYILMFILLILSAVSFALPLSVTIEISFMSMIIYYWAIYRPTLIPPLLVFIIGIVLDLLGGLPVGLNAFIFLTLRQIISDQRLFLMGQPFIVIWLVFAVVSTVVLLFQWVLFGFIHWEWTPIQPVILSIISGTFFFPVVGAILYLSHRILPLSSDHYSMIK